MRITVRYYAGARAAAGADEESLELPGGASVADAISALRAGRSTALNRVLDAASYLVDGIAVRNKAVTISDGSRLDVLPPFAGG